MPEKDSLNRLEQHNSKSKLLKDRYEMFSLLQKQWPNAQCELVHFNDFQLLIAVVLSAQTTDKAVNKALAPLFENCKTFSPDDLIEMGQENFYQIIKSIGLAPTKSKNAYSIAKILVEKFNGQVPKIREELESLPGVGRKTANVVLNVRDKLPTMPVDTHVARVSQRLGLVKPTTDRLKIEADLLKIIPSDFLQMAHILLIFHGRYLCTARNPKCSICPVDHLCPKIQPKIN